MSSLSALVQQAWRLQRCYGRGASTPPSLSAGVSGSRGAAAMTVSTCTRFARSRIFRATGFRVTPAFQICRGGAGNSGTEIASIWRREARHGFGSRFARRRISCGAT
jgi:hypothetical protein